LTFGAFFSLASAMDATRVAMAGAGYAPAYSARALDDDGSDMRYVREAIERLLASHGPYPACH
jgi:hypothetical protein